MVLRLLLFNHSTAKEPLLCDMAGGVEERIKKNIIKRTRKYSPNSKHYVRSTAWYLFSRYLLKGLCQHSGELVVLPHSNCTKWQNLVHKTTTLKNSNLKILLKIFPPHSQFHIIPNSTYNHYEYGSVLMQRVLITVSLLFLLLLFLFNKVFSYMVYNSKSRIYICTGQCKPTDTLSEFLFY